MGKLFKKTDKNFGINLDQDDLDVLKKRVFSEYGYPTVKVEINDEQFQMIIHSAVEYLNTYSPRFTEVQTLINPNQSDYTFDELDRDITGVLDAYYTIDYHIMAGAPPQVLFPEISMLRASSDPTIMSEFVTRAAQHSMAKTIFGCTPSHPLIPPRTIRISPKPLMESLVIFKITTDHDEDLGSLDDYEKNWLIKFCTARVGKVLGRIRTKFTGVTLPIGDLSSDGSNLLSESREIEKELVDEIKIRHKFAESYLFVG